MSMAMAHVSRLTGALSAGVQAFRAALWTHPQYRSTSFAPRHSAYELMLAYFSNVAFDDYAAWASYRQRYSLYKYTRLIYNPVFQIVMFYVDHIYDGALSIDGQDLPSGIPSAIPFTSNTPPEVQRAASQLFTWSNWSSMKHEIPLYTAMCGESLVEVDDDLDSQKLKHNLLWPGQIDDLVLDRQGNVKAYALKYEILDPSAPRNHPRTVVFHKIVTAEKIEFRMNNLPFKYKGIGPEVDNPYGFAPAVYYKHGGVGGLHGIPAVNQGLTLIDEINSLMSHVHDHQHKWIDSPRIFWAMGGIGPLFKKRAPKVSDDVDLVFERDFEDKNSVLMLKGPKDGKTDTLVSEPQVDKTILLYDRAMAQLERYYSELTLYETLRKMNQVTGPGADRLVGDVARKVRRSASGYDTNTVKLLQMSEAIGGFRFRNGFWPRQTSQHQLFADFDLSSYDENRLQMAIRPRTLLVTTPADEAGEFLTRAQGVQAAGDVLDDLERLLRLGYSLARATEIMKRKAEEQPTLDADTDNQDGGGEPPA